MTNNIEDQFNDLIADIEPQIMKEETIKPLPTWTVAIFTILGPLAFASDLFMNKMVVNNLGGMFIFIGILYFVHRHYRSLALNPSTLPFGRAQRPNQTSSDSSASVKLDEKERSRWDDIIDRFRDNRDDKE